MAQCVLWAERGFMAQPKKWHRAIRTHQGLCFDSNTQLERFVDAVPAAKQTICAGVITYLDRWEAHRG